MDEQNKELSAELKLKLLQVEREAEKTTVPREKVLKSALLGMVAFAIIPFFGAFRFAMWQVIAASAIFGVTGAFLFGMASVCRSNKK